MQCLLPAADQDDLVRRHGQPAGGGQPARDRLAQPYHTGGVIGRRGGSPAGPPRCAAARASGRAGTAPDQGGRFCVSPMPPQQGRRDSPAWPDASGSQSRGADSSAGGMTDERALGGNRLQMAFGDQPLIDQQYRDAGDRELVRHHAGGRHAGHRAPAGRPGSGCAAVQKSVVAEAGRGRASTESALLRAPLCACCKTHLAQGGGTVRRRAGRDEIPVCHFSPRLLAARMTG